MIIDIIVAIVVYFFLILTKWKRLKLKNKILYTLMYIYIVLVIRVTLMPFITNIPFIFNHPYIPMRLEPYYDLTNNISGAKVEVILNIIMMMPFGFLLPLVKEKKFSNVVLYTFLFSLGIEVIQPLINGSRTSDITDLINNTLGGIIGYIIYRILKSIIKK